MLQYQLKLRPSRRLERQLEAWLWNLTGVWNWGVGQIKHDPSLNYENLCSKTVGHATKIGLPAVVLQATLSDVSKAWKRCFNRVSGAPRRKSARRPLRSIPFKDPIKLSAGNRVSLPLLGKLRYHKQEIPKGRIKSGRLVKKASGWYLCLFIDAQRKPVERRLSGAIGIDPGYDTLLTLSNGDKVEHPKELRRGAERLAQAQRGHDKFLAARLQERVANQKKDRNHKISLDLVQRFLTIYFSKDNVKNLQRSLFGKSVSAANHYQLRQMLKYKSLAGGTRYTEVDSKFSTRTCSSCGALTGPAGLPGLKVRHWECSGCGSQHDRDINSAINTLNVGVGRTLERRAQ